MSDSPRISPPRRCADQGPAGFHVPCRLDREETTALRLVIASEVRFLRECLGEVLGRVASLSVVGYGANLDQTLKIIRDLRPDMVLFDAAMHDGPQAVRQLRKIRAGLQVVAFAVSESVDTVLSWAEAGVAGYIPNTTPMNDLHALVVEISAGRQICSPLVAAGLLQRVAAIALEPTDQAAGHALTPRELEIVRLISAGLSNKEIARQLNIGLATAKSHVHNVLGKLKVQRRGQVAFSQVGISMYAGAPRG
jgi:two-component system, NarL family, nitrate/nitrite response regulator NarL